MYRSLFPASALLAAAVLSPGLSGCAAAPSSAHADAKVAQIGQPAPDFTLQTTDGAAFSLSEQRGKTVVLEWFNPDCPFVRHAYDDGPLGTLGNRWTDQGVVWVAINSGSPGKQGAGADRNTKARADWSMKAPVLLDESGDIGRMFEAKTTPQMAVINAEGVLVYNGALDNAPLGKAPKSGLQVYVDEVLTQVVQDGAAPYARQKPYGCSVKY